ncbi:hypothetical protein [Sphingobium sp. EM0848]|uniref:hypothetical protein n=1 Tax=Sphingobium sp. EM0848 TaxID=2743473 RepID=UPI00159BF447|nr:hypothetical protein [Sphingobium sp. EM0848]
MTTPERDYCYFIDHRKYNRNIGCRRHDNAYGINGGGSERDRWRADMAFYRHMKGEGDPMALPSLLACLCFGWFCWNYHPGKGLWRGQLLRRFVKAPK